MGIGVAAERTRRNTSSDARGSMLRPCHLLLALWLAAPTPGLQPAATAAPELDPGSGFVDVAASAGLGSFEHRAGSPEKPYLPETIGSGVALVDYDNDGWLDVYLLTALSEEARDSHVVAPNPAALFRNNRDGTFTDVTKRAGVANGRWGVGVCSGDIDNDGWTDLYVTNFGANRLYMNNGDGTFTDTADQAGVEASTWTTGCAFGDYDRDGLLDLYVAGYVAFDWDNPPPPGGSAAPAPSRFPERREAGLLRPAIGAAYNPEMPACVYRGTPVACGPKGLAPAADYLFRNEGNGNFRDVTSDARLSEAEPSYGLGVAWVDVDNDGHPDVVVANDSMANFLFHNRGDGTFEEIGLLSGLGTNGDGYEQAYMGVAVGDYSRDGRADFFFTTFAGDNYTLHRNNGGLDFSDATLGAGIMAVTLPFLGWGTGFFDFDNDGWLDLFAANGHIFPQANPASWGTSYRQTPLLLRNTGDGRFEEVSGSAGAGFARARSARGAALGDLFNDGSLDIVLNNLDSGPALLRNSGSPATGRWIAVKLIGDPARMTPRDAIGSVVYCHAGGARQRGEVASGRSYLSQNDLRVHFGLGSSERVERLEIVWAGGQRESHEPPTVDRIFVIEQGKGLRDR